MEKNKIGNLLGLGSILTVVSSIIYFYITRGPNVDVYMAIIIYTILSVIGIVFAIFSWIKTRNFILLVAGLIGNGSILVMAFFLLLAMGISEP